MPKQGGQGKGKPKRSDRGMGKALVRQHVKGDKGSRGIKLGEEKNLKSVLDNSALDDFVGTAVMGDADVEVMRVHKNDSFLIQPTVHTNVQTMVLDQYDFEHLRIPRKPAWTREMTSEDLDRNERDAFLEWRREIATIEASRPNTRVTPFEKNIEVWRQLWRVIERCDIAIQIVDARNPLLYYSKDLLKYASEQDPVRPMMILVNKADYLTERQRIEWAKEFSRHNIKFAFYSAFNEQKVIDTKASHSLESELAELIVGVDNDDEDDDEDEDEDDEDEGTVAKEVKSTPVEKICEEETYHGIDYLLHG
jgi:large subunit GTPase 1